VVYETIHKIAERGTTILLAEQSAHIALKLAQRAYVLETGALAFSGEAAQMRNDPAMREAYLGV
jgi:branched-chain amino acid transport system ATP-binding protein